MQRLRSAWFGFLAAGIAATGLFALSPSSEFGVAMYSAIGVAASLAMFAGARRIGGAAGRPWLAFGLGTLLFAVGDLIWDLGDLLGWNLPTPSAADAFYFAGYPVLWVGFLLLARTTQAGRAPRTAVDAAIVGLAITAIVWAPYYSSFRASHAPALERLTLGAYPSADLLLLTLFAAFVLAHPFQARAWIPLLGLAVVLLLTADLLWAVAPDSYSAGSWMDRLWLVSYVVWGAAALHPSTLEPVWEPPVERGLDRQRFVFLAVPVGALPLGVGIEVLTDRRLSLVDGAIGVLLLALLLGRLGHAVWGLDSLRRELTDQNTLLSASEERFRRLFRHAGVGLATLDAEGRVTAVNEKLLEIGRGTREQVIGRPLSDFVPPDELESVLADLGRVLELGRYGPTEHRLRALDGSEIWVLTGSTVLPEPEGPVVLIDIQDIGERKRAEQELERRNELLRASEERFRRVFSDAPVPMAIMEPSGTIAAVNEALVAAIRLPARAIVGHPYLELVHPDDRRPSLEAFANGMRDGVWPPAERRFVGGGGELWTIVSLARLPDGSILAHLHDITDRKRYEAELQEADRQKDDLIAVVSHDLRTPLTSIVGYLELAQEADVTDEERAEFLDIASRNATRLARLVEDLLFVSRAQAGRAGLELQDVDLDALLSGAVDVAKPAAGAKGVRLGILGEGGEIVADAHRLAEAVDNLVSNAIKFSPEGGLVAIEVETQDDDVAIRVRDEGPGIRAEDVEHVFDRFFRASGSEGVPGAGLGLAIVQAIAHAHGGAVSVESVFGEGASFELRLPRDGPAVEPGALSGARVASP